MTRTARATTKMQVLSVHGPQPATEAADRILTPEALEFVLDLQRTFGRRRQELLEARARRDADYRRGRRPGFLDATREVRAADWTVAPAPDDLQDRRVEITGPTDAKMMINALNSGAKVFMADLEDANSPTWANMVEGQANLAEAVRGSLEFTKDDRTHYAIGDDPATLVVRPRGWHLDEPAVTVDDAPASASLVDFGLYFFHNAHALRGRGSGPYFYLPKLESHLEARLWNDVFVHAQESLGIPRGTIRATVLIETLPAAFEMDEILYELREHAAGLNAGRWDYIFSAIKTLREDPEAVLPDRGEVTMTVPFMRAYADLIVQTCHRRGAHAMGGMAAAVPDRKDPARTEAALEAVRADKRREVEQGCDGTWVAHPALVPVAMEIFDEGLGDAPHQKDHPGPKREVTARDLLDVQVDGGTITEAGLVTNIDVGIRYLAAWLSGRGAVAIHGLMEDAATAEISRSQVWQWIRHGARLDDGRVVDVGVVRPLIEDVALTILDEMGEDAYARFRFPEARRSFEQAATAEQMAPFLTTHALPTLLEDRA